MKSKHLFILLLALFATSVAQNDDELQIPMENDNQFPPDNHPELDRLPEGSGAGIEEPVEATTKTESPAPLLEEVQHISHLAETTTTAESPTSTHSCPTPCVCNIEGDSKLYRVDCSGYGLTELPKSLDVKTTELNLQNNNLTQIPKELSALKNLQILNVNNNQIMEITAGSISELPELKSLKLSNNRLLEYPTDLKNGFGLTKLEELDLGGNDMRTGIQSETFSNFKALQKLTLPSAAAKLAEDLCVSLKETLQTVCTESCSQKSFDCPDADLAMEDDLLDVVLPGLIAVGTTPDENGDPSISTVKTDTANQDNLSTTAANEVEASGDTTVASESTTEASIGESSFRSAVMKASNEEPKAPAAEEPKSTVAEPKSTNVELKSTEVKPNSDVKAKTDGEVVGATTANTKTGGVDKSVIGMIVAGMVLVVAGITIKKNWSSIKNRFSSSPRTANDRTGTTANGTTPEEVPLQEKSPV